MTMQMRNLPNAMLRTRAWLAAPLLLIAAGCTQTSRPDGNQLSSRHLPTPDSEWNPGNFWMSYQPEISLGENRTYQYKVNLPENVQPQSLLIAYSDKAADFMRTTSTSLQFKVIDDRGTILDSSGGPLNGDMWQPFADLHNNGWKWVDYTDYHIRYPKYGEANGISQPGRTYTFIVTVSDASKTNEYMKVIPVVQGWPAEGICGSFTSPDIIIPPTH